MDGDKVRKRWREISKHLSGHHRGYLRAKAGMGSQEGAATSAADYRGPENQLYRVEVHKGGEAASTGLEGATFKWSRENGSVVFPIVAPVEGKTVTLGQLGRDGRSNLQVGDWVEIADDDSVLQNRAAPLLQVEQIYMDTLQVILKDPINSEMGRT